MEAVCDVSFSTAAFGSPSECARLRRRDWQAAWDTHSYVAAIEKPFTCVSNGGRVPRGAPERQVQSIQQWRRAVRNARFLERARPSAERRRSKAGTNTARRLTCFVPALLRGQKPTWYGAREPLFCRLECGRIRWHPPNTALQLTASRARSPFFNRSLSSALAATERHAVRRHYQSEALY